MTSTPYRIPIHAIDCNIFYRIYKQLTSVHCAVHGNPISSNTVIRYGLAGMNVANDQKKKKSIMNKNGRLSSGVQKLLNVSSTPPPVCFRSANASMSAENKNQPLITIYVILLCIHSANNNY